MPILSKSTKSSTQQFSITEREAIEVFSWWMESVRAAKKSKRKLKKYKTSKAYIKACAKYFMSNLRQIQDEADGI